MIDLQEAKNKYSRQKSKAKHRGIDFLFTFEEWWDIWQKSGHWHERGLKCGQYVMARKGDVGPYSTGNVVIITTSENLAMRKMPIGLECSWTKWQAGAPGIMWSKK